jgi:hypothetical protein
LVAPGRYREVNTVRCWRVSLSRRAFSVSINDQWRVCFRFVDGDAYDVEVCDYH